MMFGRRACTLAFVAPAMSCAVFAPALAAGERVEYEGELRFNLSSPFGESAPLVHVVTEDGWVRQITLTDERGTPGQIEEFFFDGGALVRYRAVSAVSGQIIANCDLSAGSGVSVSERGRIERMAEVLLRHFHQKGGYRQVAAGGKNP